MIGSKVDLTPALASLMPHAAEDWLNQQSTWLLLLFAAIAMAIVIKGEEVFPVTIKVP